MAKLSADNIQMDHESEHILEEIRNSRGLISNLMKTLSPSPGALQGFSRLGGFVRYQTDVTELERELAITCTVRSVRYGWAHHAPLALSAGASPEQMSALKAGRVPDDFAPAHQDLCRFVLAFSSLQGVPQEVMDAVRQHYTPRQIVEIAVSSAYFIAIGSLVAAFEVEVEDERVLQTELKWEEGKRQRETTA